MIFAGFVLGLAIVASAPEKRALAQEAPPSPPAQFVPAPPPAPAVVAAPPSPPAQFVPPPAPAPDVVAAPPPRPEQLVPPPAPDVVFSPPPPQGQWINTAEYGLVWVPAGTVTYAVGDTPCAYLYTHAYGWTWYASPWGPGRFAVGAWVARRSPYGYRAWAHGPHGWGWHGGPRVTVRIAPRARDYGYAHPRHAYPSHAYPRHAYPSHAYPSRAYPQYRHSHDGYGRGQRGRYDGYGRGQRGGHDGYGRSHHDGRRGYR